MWAISSWFGGDSLPLSQVNGSVGSTNPDIISLQKELLDTETSIQDNRKKIQEYSDAYHKNEAQLESWESELQTLSSDVEKSKDCISQLKEQHEFSFMKSEQASTGQKNVHEESSRMLTELESIENEFNDKVKHHEAYARDGMVKSQKANIEIATLKLGNLGQKMESQRFANDVLLRKKEAVENKVVVSSSSVAEIEQKISEEESIFSGLLEKFQNLQANIQSKKSLMEQNREEESKIKNIITEDMERVEALTSKIEEVKEKDITEAAESDTISEAAEKEKADIVEASVLAVEEERRAVLAEEKLLKEESTLLDMEAETLKLKRATEEEIRLISMKQAELEQITEELKIDVAKYEKERDEAVAARKAVDEKVAIAAKMKAKEAEAEKELLDFLAKINAEEKKKKERIAALQSIAENADKGSFKYGKAMQEIISLQNEDNSGQNEAKIRHEHLLRKQQELTLIATRALSDVSKAKKSRDKEEREADEAYKVVEEKNEKHRLLKKEIFEKTQQSKKAEKQYTNEYNKLRSKRKVKTVARRKARSAREATTKLRIEQTKLRLNLKI